MIKKIEEWQHNEEYVYDLTTSNHHFQAGVGSMIVHNTDSIFTCYRFRENVKRIKDTSCLPLWQDIIKFSKVLLGEFMRPEEREIWDKSHDKYYNEINSLSIPPGPEYIEPPSHWKIVRPVEERIEQYLLKYMEEGYLSWLWSLQDIFTKEYIDPNRDILEIGAHCGTSTVLYSSFLHDSRRLFAYEPQKNMYTVLLKNIEQNGLQSKVIPYNSAVFCYEGSGEMHSMALDTGCGVVAKAYAEPANTNFNFGGVCLGQDGEAVKMTTVDLMGLDDIGFIHCDAQGAENYIFSNAVETIRRCRPVILYENNFAFGKNYHDNVSDAYPHYEKESLFNVSQYCMDELGYSQCIDKFNWSIDTLLIP